MSLSESGFVAAAVASWLGIDKRLPVSASRGMLTYDATELHDSRRGEMVARVIRKGKRIAVVFDPNAGQRYGSWGRSGDCVARMLREAWRALNTDKGNVLISSGRGELHRDPAELVKRLAAGNDYAAALALAPFAGVKKRDIPLPTLPADSGTSRMTESIKRQSQEAAHYLVPELAKERRKREREEREARKREELRRHREWTRLRPYREALDAAHNRLYNLQNSVWSLETLLDANGSRSVDVQTAIRDNSPAFKVTLPGGVPCSGGVAGDTWPLPQDGQPGAWTPNREPRVCGRGWHLATPRGVSRWIKAGAVQELWLAEGRGNTSHQRDKVAFESARLVRLLAGGDLITMGKLAPDTVAIEAAREAIAIAESNLAFASQGY
ncbi:MAG: hypothetical protein E6Q76_15745 [Rhizobium sp.]|nr:MAG: hypothetical protein E6Q76_15745 [Rhizobium sp.]